MATDMATAGPRAPETPLALHRPEVRASRTTSSAARTTTCGDRKLAHRILDVLPQAADAALAARAFLAGSVRLLAERGLRQFVDLGCGLPRADNPHQMAARHSRHPRRLRRPRPARHRPRPRTAGRRRQHRGAARHPRPGRGAGQPGGAAADRPGRAGGAAALLRPALPARRPRHRGRHLAASAAPGSGLVVSHLTADFAPAAIAEAARIYREASGVPVTRAAAPRWRGCSDRSGRCRPEWCR